LSEAIVLPIETLENTMRNLSGNNTVQANVQIWDSRSSRRPSVANLARTDPSRLAQEEQIVP
jgi:hypothetical protein